MKSKRISRRKFIAQTAVVTSAAIAAPYVRGAYAAGKLAVGFWDHWVPGANDTLTKLCNEWAAKEKVDIKIDYITSQGDKDLLTIAAERQARSGHDILQMRAWEPLDKADSLEPIDDVMSQLIAENGKVSTAVEYLGKRDGHWVGGAGDDRQPGQAAVRAHRASSRRCAGIDVQKMYPVGDRRTRRSPTSGPGTRFLAAAEKCFKGGSPFGLGLGQTSDSVDWTGAVFASHGAVLVDQEGNITVKSDETRQVLEWFKKLVPFLPTRHLRL